MSRSMASSDPLSSPSPSPPPVTRSRLSNKSAAQQLDTSSELSELTDEDIDADKATPPSEEEEEPVIQPHPMEEEEDEEEQSGIRHPVNVVRAPRYRDVHEDDMDDDE